MRRHVDPRELVTLGSSEALSGEARAFGRYLLGRSISARAVELYVKAHQHAEFDLDDRDRRLLAFAIRHPGAVCYLDAGLALIKRRSHLRKKIYYLLVVLEAMPEYVDDFTCQRRSMPVTGLALAGVGLRGAFRVCVGTVLCLWI